MNFVLVKWILLLYCSLYFPSVESTLDQASSKDKPAETKNARNQDNPKSPPAKSSYPFDSNAIRKLVQIEGAIYLQVMEYIKKTKSKLMFFHSFVQEFNESSLAGGTIKLFSAEQEYIAVANPIVLCRMMRRFVTVLPAIHKYLTDAPSPNLKKTKHLVVISNVKDSPLNLELLKSLERIKGDVIYPDESDYRESVYSLLRIQFYSSLAPYDLVNGRLGHWQTRITIRPSHAFSIGVIALMNQQWTVAVEWMEAALKKLRDEQKYSKFDTQFTPLRDTIDKKLKEAVEEHDKECFAQGVDLDMQVYCFTEKIGWNYGSMVKGPSTKRRMTVMDVEKGQSALRKRDHNDDEAYHRRNNFINLCSGKTLQSQKDKSKLYCWLERKKNLYFLINPQKMELLHANMPLVQVHDFLRPNAIFQLISAATPVLTRSKVMNRLAMVNDTDKETWASRIDNDARTSSQMWFSKTKVDGGLRNILDKIERNIEVLTGLDVRPEGAGELLQMVNYGTSHHYDQHLDTINSSYNSTLFTERIATFMIYLSTVKVGGNTAFPVLGTAAKPLAGSAIFWYNYDENGNIDLRTWHGGCPVVYGIKWVANKWILNVNNAKWSRRKCPLNKKIKNVLKK